MVMYLSCNGLTEYDLRYAWNTNIKPGVFPGVLPRTRGNIYLITILLVLTSNQPPTTVVAPKTPKVQ